MKIELAGMNIDISKIKKLNETDIATPETISAAYARISRSAKSVTDLRKEAANAVKKSRKSNSSIIFDMGHSSIAEHAVFNFDLIGVSRYLTEIIQRSRLASFTEKSQRYVTLDGDYIIPKEIEDENLKKQYKDIIKKQNNLYFSLYERAKEHLKIIGFEGTKTELRGKAKEDARYVLSLSTQTQMGMTINARNLERLLRRLDKTGLAEAAELRENILEQTVELVPSLLKYTIADDYDKEISFRIPKIQSQLLEEIEMIGYTAEGDDKILTGLISEASGSGFLETSIFVMQMKNCEKIDVFNSIFKDMKSYHALPRAFELADISFQFLISSSCFAQLKRHRMSTILRSDYHPDYGYVVPPIFEELGLNNEIKAVLAESEALFFKLEEISKGLGAYILTNSHKLPVIFKTNLREFYHFARLRSDKHAQWEIRDLSKKVEKIIKEKFPLAAQYMMGKHELNC